MLITKSFNFSDIGLKKLRKNSNYRTEKENNENFVSWILNQLREICDNEDKKYNATSIYMNKKNLDKLQKHLDSMVWLNYSPTECDDLQNGEYGVDLTSILEDF